MKKTIAFLIAIAVAGVASADMMYANINVGYGLYNSAGNAGFVTDVVGNEITMQVVSGNSGITLGGPLSYVVDLSMLGTVLGTSTRAIETTGVWWDYATGLAVDVAWQTYDADAWVVLTGTGTDEVYVALVSTYIVDRAYDQKALPNVIAIDSPDGQVAHSVQLNANAIVIPEPATIGLMGIAGLGMFLARRKVRR